MYTHVREVFTGLILLVVSAIGSGVLAFVGPFADPWTAWGGMVLGSILAIMVSLAVSTTTDSSEKEFWGAHAGMLFLAIPFLWGITVALVFDGVDAGGPMDAAAAWATFGSAMVVYTVTSLVYYMVAASSSTSHRSRLRNVA